MSRPCTSRDAGFTVVELMVVVLLVGLLAGLAIPALRAQAIHAKDATVARDMQTYATAADRYYSATFGYPTDASGFDLVLIETVGTGSSSSSSGAVANPSPGSAQAIAKAMLGKYGWSDD